MKKILFIKYLLVLKYFNRVGNKLGELKYNSPNQFHA